MTSYKADRAGGHICVNVCFRLLFGMFGTRQAIIKYRLNHELRLLRLLIYPEGVEQQTNRIETKN